MKIGRRALLGLALVGGLARGLAAVPRRQPTVLDAELAAIVADPACQLSSLSVLAIRHGKVAYQQQFGRQCFGAGCVAANPSTLFRIASVSKLMTTLALMRLVEAGQLALDADAGSYLGFALRNPHFPDRALTLRSLLSHTSSLRDDAGYAWPADVPLSSVLANGGAMWASNAAPGDYFSYCNLGWGVIGTIMERVSGERFDRLMRRLLLAPLGMRGGYNPAEFSSAELASVATLYRKRTTGTEVWNAAGPWIAQADDYSVHAPAAIDAYVIGSNATPFSPTGGLRASAADLGKVMLMLINDGQALLQPATLRAMFARQWTYDGNNGETDHGLYQGWGLGNQQFAGPLVEGGGFTGVGHLGDAYGLMSAFVFDRAARSGMIMLAGGVSSDPAAQPGAYSAMPRFQERILTALYRRVLA